MVLHNQGKVKLLFVLTFVLIFEGLIVSLNIDYNDFHSKVKTIHVYYHKLYLDDDQIHHYLYLDNQGRHLSKYVI